MKLFTDLGRGLLLSAVLLAIGYLAVCDGGDSGTGAGNDTGNSTGGGTGNDTGVNIASNTCTGAATCKTVTIGGVVWMAENLNMAAGNSWCYGDSDSYCDKYGRLYDWGTAAAVCPSGWRLPSREDWDSLARSVGGRKHEEEWVEWHYWELAGKKLKSSSGWDTMALTNDTGGLSGEILDGNGTDEFGFSALPGGVRNGSDRNFYSVGSYGAWWTAMGYDSDNAYYRGMEYNEGLGEGYSNVGNGYSVRCVKNEGGSVAPTVYALTASASPITGGAVSFIPDAASYAPGAQVTVTASAAAGYAFTGWSGAAAGTANPITIVMDGNKTVTANFTQNPVVPPDGNVEYVELGSKKWMSKNLNIHTEDSWCYGEGGQVHDYSNDTWKTLTSSEIQTNCNKYGRLYTWEVAKSACPLAGSGWRLPTREDWDDLAEFVGGRRYDSWGTLHKWYDAGKYLKSQTGWNSYNEVENLDTYGFSALPGGIRDTDGSFSGVGSDGRWWTATEYGSGGAYLRDLWFTNDDMDEERPDVGYGCSVRCVGDRTLDTYTVTFNANGGTVFPTSGMTGTNGKLASLPTPQWSGYTFSGWYIAATGGTQVTTNTVFTGNTTIYAHWTAVSAITPTYTVMFNANGGTVSPASNTTGTDGKLVNLPTPTSDGYAFSGWYTAATGGSVVMTSTIFSSNATIYAHWTVIVGGDNCTSAAICKKVIIGTQTWMAENLNIPTADSWCYDNEPVNCAKYGRLYRWDAAKSACPAGWHLPNRAEWDALVSAVGFLAGIKLKSSIGWTYYDDSYIGTDDYGFSALPGGYRNSGIFFYDVGNRGLWWTATEDNASRAYIRGMDYDYGAGEVYSGSYTKGSALSVRCVRD